MMTSHSPKIILFYFYLLSYLFWNFRKHLFLKYRLFSVICFCIRAQRFHLPQKPEPVIMIGPGTGIAPFRSFWQQKICENIGNGKKGNDMTMFFGCRHPHHDNIYAKELQEAKDIGVLTNVFTAYSRHPNQPKVNSIQY